MLSVGMLSIAIGGLVIPSIHDCCYDITGNKVVFACFSTQQKLPRARS